VGISQYTGRKYSQAATRFEDEGEEEAGEADDLEELEGSAVPALGVAWDDEEHATTAPASPMATKIDRPFITCTPTRLLLLIEAGPEVRSIAVRFNVLVRSFLVTTPGSRRWSTS
jgi:hypothetical protein